MFFKQWIRNYLGIPNPDATREFQVTLATAIAQIKGNQMNEQQQIAALTAQVTAFANAFAAFIQTATTSKQNDANRIADLTAKWKAALAADAVDQTTIAQLTAENTDLNNAASVHDATVTSQLQTAQDALSGLQQQLTAASAVFTPTDNSGDTGTTAPPINSDASTATNGMTSSTANGDAAPPTVSSSPAPVNAENDLPSASNVAPGNVEDLNV